MFFWKKKPKVKAKEITDNNFNDVVLKSDKPVLVDFWGENCGPCRVLGPFVDNIANKYKENATVVKLCVNHNPKISRKYKIRSVPTILFFHKGELVEKYTGLIPQPNLEKILESYM